MPGLGGFNGFTLPKKDSGSATSPFKSIQRGIANIPSSGSISVSLSAIDPKKTIILVSSSVQAGAVANPSQTLVRGQIDNTNSISLARDNASSADATIAYWTVIEFTAPVKSKQTGVYAAPIGSSQIITNAINVSKTLLFFTVSNSVTSGTAGFNQSAYLSSPSTIDVWANSATTQFAWQLIELY